MRYQSAPGIRRTVICKALTVAENGTSYRHRKTISPIGANHMLDVERSHITQAVFLLQPQFKSCPNRVYIVSNSVTGKGSLCGSREKLPTLKVAKREGSWLNALVGLFVAQRHKREVPKSCSHTCATVVRLSTRLSSSCVNFAILLIFLTSDNIPYRHEAAKSDTQKSQPPRYIQPQEYRDIGWTEFGHSKITEGRATNPS